MDVGTPLLIQAEFSRLARDTVRPGYMRLTMEDRLFYAYADQFVASDLFDRLQAGDKVLVGAHSLQDAGTFWLHWLHVPGKGDAIGRGKQNRIVLQVVCGVLGILFLGIALSADIASVWFLILFPPAVILLSLFSIWTILPLFYFRAHTSECRRFLEIGLEKARMGLNDLSSITRAKDLPLPARHQIKKEYCGDLARFLDTVQGEVINATGKRHTPHRRRYYTSYCFDCGDHSLFWVDEKPEETWDYRAPEFITRRPRFLAESDRVTAVIPTRLPWRPSNEFQPTPQPGRREAAVLVNHSDARVYAPVYRRQSLLLVRKLAFIAFLFALCMVVTSIFNVFSRSPVLTSESSLAGGASLYGVTAFFLGCFELMYGWETVFLEGDAYQQRLDSVMASTNGFTQEPRWQWRHSRWKAIVWFLFFGVSVAGAILLFFAQ